MEAAVRELLIKKGIITAHELQRVIETTEARDGGVLGKKVVARAWVDPDFKSLLLREGNAAIAKFGFSLGGVTELAVVENTPSVHNIIVCTLCSCYPRGLLGLPPSWYKSKEYRSRVIREPREVLAEFGTIIQSGVEVRVHDSLADLRYMVLPMRPANTEGFSETALVDLVTRDSMVGVSVLNSAMPQ
jgi:nitrile hydratase